MENGASPQGVCFSKKSKNDQPSHGTVLSRLIGSTRNANNEVQNLLRDAASLKVDHIITLQDLNAIVKAQGANPGKHIEWESWRKQTLQWRHHSLWRQDRDMQLWQSIAIANISQQQKVSDPYSKSTLIKEVAWRRDVWAVRTLLDMGLDPNGRRDGWKFWQLKLTALDFVAWTNSVNATECDESGLCLKAIDAEIIDLLRSRGGTRGVEYIFEYQLFLAFFQNLIIPAAGLLSLSFISYNSFPWIPKFWARGLDFGREDWEDLTKDEADMAQFFYYFDRVGTACWSLLSTLSLVAVGLKSPDAGQALAGCLCFGFVAGLVKLLLAATQGETTKKVITNSFQFDGALYLFLTSTIACFCFLLSIPIYWFNGRLGRLAKDIQGSSSSSLVWRASCSPMKEFRERISQLLWDSSVAVMKHLKIGKFQRYWKWSRRDGFDIEHVLVPVSNRTISAEEDIYTAEDNHRVHRFKAWTYHFSNIPKWLKNSLASAGKLIRRERSPRWYLGSDDLVVEDDEDVRLLEDFDD
jgi:hypothetical protein